MVSVESYIRSRDCTLLSREYMLYIIHYAPADYVRVSRFRGETSALTISPIAPSLRYTPTTIIRSIRLQLVRLSNISERKTIFSKTRFPSIFISIIIYLVYIYIQAQRRREKSVLYLCTI